MSRGAWRYESLERNTNLIKSFCAKYKFDLRQLTEYQYRIEDVVDVYPVRQKWHWLETDERGHFSDEKDLKRVILDRLPEVQEDTPNTVHINEYPVTALPMQITINGKTYNLIEVEKSA